MFFIKKNYKKLILIIILLILLAYTASIEYIPNNIILFQNQQLDIKALWGVELEETLEVGSNISKPVSSNSETKTYNLRLFGINLKKIKTNILQDVKVVLGGNLVGIKLFTQGVLVVGMSEIKGEDGKTYKPFEESGIEQGDSILEINDVKVNSTEELIECVSKGRGKEINITYEKDGQIFNTQITPVKTDKNTYKLGLWVRDAEAGIGTVTFYDKQTNSFAALGHGIQDIDTGELVEISSGEFVTADILGIKKGEKDNPGRIEGTIEKGEKIGEIYSNTDFGVYGNITNIKELNVLNTQEIEVASRSEIDQGKASIICTLEDGKTEEYDIEIQKIYINNNENNKSMVVKVIDNRLLEKTGGIIQGMSGSPVIQNGKLIGALTHVLVSDPTKGYALFADIMVSKLKNIE